MVSSKISEDVTERGAIYIEDSVDTNSLHLPNSEPFELTISGITLQGVKIIE